MSTEDNARSAARGRRNGTGRGQIAYGEMAESMSRSRERLRSGGNSSGRNSAILKQQIAQLERIIALARPPAALAQRPALN